MLAQGRKIIGLLTDRQRQIAALLVVLMIALALAEAGGIAMLYGAIDMALGNDGAGIGAKVQAILGLEARPAFLLLCVGAAFCYVFKFAGGLSSTYVTERLTWSLYATLARQLFRFYLGRPYAFHLKANSNDLIHNLISVLVNITRTGLNHWVTLAADVVQFTAVVTMILYLQPVISLTAMAVLAVLAGSFLVFGRRRLRLWGGEVSRANAELYRSAQEALSVVKEIKLYGRETFFVTRLDNALGRLSRTSVKTTMLMQTPRPLLETVVVVSVIVALAIVHLGDSGTTGLISLLVLFAASAQRLMPAALRAVNAMQYIRFMDPFVDSIHGDVIAARAEPDIRFALPPPPPDFQRIVFDGVSLTYEGAGRKALDGLDLSIAKGDVVGIVGPSGSGKSTLVDVLLGLLVPDGGEVRVETDAGPVAPSTCKGLFGYVPQSIYLLDNTILSNILLGSEPISEARLRRLIEICQLPAFLEDQPQGIDTLVGERGVRLSGGQRQRIAWARAMVGDPRILVLDEATAALDTVTEAAITRAIDGLRGDKTLVIVAHRLSTVQHCDYLVVMDHGRVAGMGTYEELRKNNPLFGRMVEDMAHQGLAADPTGQPQAQEA